MQTPSDDKVDPLIGVTLAERYSLTRKLGEGGMGAVYEASHVVLGKAVAVKVLRDKYLDRPEVAQRLVQEARLASSIRHEHIIDITDSGSTTDGRTFVVMELLDGQSLAELIRQEGPIPEPRALDIVRQVASALGAAHARRIVHRDVKPENIFLVDKNGTDFVKVVDFGISKSMRPGDSQSADARLTHTGMVLGTPLYMSPEQARGDEDLDHRIDVYALGVILYECLTGEVPFRASNYNGIIAQVVNQEATPPRLLRPELRISEAVERVVGKAMSKGREQRYPTMEAFEADLARVTAGEAVAAPLPPPPKKKPSAWRNPLIAVTVAAGLCAAGVVMFVVGRHSRPWNDPPPPSAAQPPLPPPAAVAQPPKSVVVHINTVPPGAEVRQGDHVFGKAPRDLLLPRSDDSVHLTFHLDGYDATAADVVPRTDYAVNVQLTKAKRPHAARPPPPALPTEKPAKERDKKPSETLPNPY